jgi:hypothetical protein
MPQEVINGIGIAGIRNPVAVAWDADAVAFTTAATITNETQKTAVNDLVLDLKAVGLWTKMNALYPMVGGTAASHKWNLKDPRDLDAAYRLDFQGGWTHSSTGALPNGTNGYAKTFISTSVIGLNTGHLSYYSRTNDLVLKNMIEIGAYKSAPDSYTGIQILSAGSTLFRWNNGLSVPSVSNIPNTLGLYVAARTASNVMSGYKNGTVVAGFSTTATSYATSTIKMYLGAGNSVGTSTTVTDSPVYFSNKECAFASVGSGLTQSESLALYQIVEKFQAALGRNVNASRSFYYNKNYSNETNAFIFNSGITDATQISATNTLVNTLKTAGIWTKMKAVYPMVGGTATAHKLNLVNPINATSAYALAFNGGWTHNSLGAKPNGSNGYANTLLTTPSTQFSSASIHMSYYNVTNSAGGTVYPNAKTEIGAGSSNRFASLYVGSGANLVAGGGLGGNVSAGVELGSGADPRGYVVVSRTTLSLLKSYKNGSLLATTTTSSSGLPTTGDFSIGINYFSEGTTQRNNWSDRQAAMITFGEGLTDAEVTTLTNAVQAFQTTLGRAV